MMKKSLYSLVLFIAVTLIGHSKAEQPNIVLILADDLGWSDLGCYGSSIKTPNLDRLAKDGIRFTQFHNTAKCYTSRACLLTGVYAQQNNMARGASKLKNAVTLAEVLRKVGYRTLAAGKHHGDDNLYDRGFDRYFGLRDGACNYFNPGERRPGEVEPGHKKGMFPRKWCIDGKTYAPYTPSEKDFYTTDYFTKYALDYLEEYKKEDKPFFLYLAYNAPHDPLQAWPKDIKKYTGKFMKGYESYRKARYERMLKMGLIDEASFPLSDSTYRDWDSLSKEDQIKEDRRMAVYAAMIDCMDQNIGKVLDKIESIGKMDNTLILFASDNGCSPGSDSGGFKDYNKGADQGEIGSMQRYTKLGIDWANVSNTPFKLFKTNAHKGGTCTPLIAYWPKGIDGKNRISHRVGHFIDFMPTFIEISKAAYPTEFNDKPVVPMQGESLLSILQNKSTDRSKPIIWQFGKGKAIRYENWRLVSDAESPWSLYNMDDDKTETTDLSKKYPEIVQKLDAMYQEWLKVNKVAKKGKKSKKRSKAKK
jgi:arylsulfatase A-like enzyme